MMEVLPQGNATASSGVAAVTVSSSRGFAMKASDLDKEPSPAMPTAREWLRVVGAAVVAICALWTIWA